MQRAHTQEERERQWQLEELRRQVAQQEQEEAGAAGAGFEDDEEDWREGEFDALWT